MSIVDTVSPRGVIGGRIVRIAHSFAGIAKPNYRLCCGQKEDQRAKEKVKYGGRQQESSAISVIAQTIRSTPQEEK